MYNVEIEEVSAKSADNIEVSMNKIGKLLIEREQLAKQKLNSIGSSSSKNRGFKLNNNNSSFKEKIKDGIGSKCNACN